jgi:HSP20 family protein
MRRLCMTEGNQDLGHLARHMTDLVHQIIHSGFTPGPKSPDWSPAVDICETEASYEIIVDLAGVHREEIEVYTESNQLVVAGWRPDPLPEGKVCVHQMEIEQGQFRRRVPLPDDADDQATSARYRDGFLFVSVPKKQPSAEKP